MRRTATALRGLRSSLFLGMLGTAVLLTGAVGRAQTEQPSAAEKPAVPEAAQPEAPAEPAKPAEAAPHAAEPAAAAPHAGEPAAAAPHAEPATAEAHAPPMPNSPPDERHVNPGAATEPLTAHVPAPHGGGHGEGPVIENWWSWDFGPVGKAHKNPPFGFALINFAVFLFVLYRLGGKSFGDFVRNRHKEVNDALGRAREAEQKAKAQLAAIEQRTKEAEKEVAALIAEMRAVAESERKLIVERAEQEAARLIKDAETQAAAAVENARRKLEQQAALLSIDLAEKLIKAQVTDGDQQRLLDRYVIQVEAMGRSARGGQS